MRRRIDVALPLADMRGMVRIAAVATLVALASPASAEVQPFRVLNRTGQDATALHAVRSPRGAQDDWGRNMLSRPLGADSAFSLRPADTAGCRFDIRLVLADGREARLTDRDICADPQVPVEPRAVAAVAAKPPPLPATGPGSTGAPPAAPNPNARVASGTGFVVARDRILTNHHVVEGCNRLLVRTADGRTLSATPPARIDATKDLALLAVPGDPGPPLAFRRDPVRRGEGVVTYGFPLAGILSSGPTLTTGEISALAGLGDNQAQFQISAPVQPGNSGGPLLDRQGNIIGVVVSKLNAQRVAQRIGDIPQNVNFAVKGQEAADFMRRAGLTPLQAESRGPEKSAAEVGEIAHRSTVFVRCER